MDPELQRKIEGLNKTQIALMADIFLGISKYLRQNEPVYPCFWLPAHKLKN